MSIDKNHEIVGKKNSDLGALDIGDLYPVLGDDNDTIIGVFGAQEGTPEGYRLDSKLQAYVLGWDDVDSSEHPRSVGEYISYMGFCADGEIDPEILSAPIRRIEECRDEYRIYYADGLYISATIGGDE